MRSRRRSSEGEGATSARVRDTVVPPYCFASPSIASWTEGRWRRRRVVVGGENGEEGTSEGGPCSRMAREVRLVE
jgi:hypothetical protein